MAEGYSVAITFIDTSSIIKKIKETGLISNVDNASLSTFVILFIQDYIPSKYDKVLYIDADTNSIILKSADLGSECVIGAGCVVKERIPNNSIFIHKRENRTILIKDKDNNE